MYVIYIICPSLNNDAFAIFYVKPEDTSWTRNIDYYGHCPSESYWLIPGTVDPNDD